MINGQVLYTDSTHLKASANKNEFKKKHIEKATRSYLVDLEGSITADRKAHGKKLLKTKEQETETREVKSSPVDPDSGYMVREGKPNGFFYLDHRTTCGKHNLITDSHVTAANDHDSIPYLDRLDRQRQRFNFPTEAVGLDAGYMSASICKGLEDRNLYGVIGYRRHRLPASSATGVRPISKADSTSENTFMTTKRMSIDVQTANDLPHHQPGGLS